MQSLRLLEALGRLFFENWAFRQTGLTGREQVTEGNRGNEEMEIRGLLRALRFLLFKYFDEF
jgi:hypothetical protein